MNVFKAWKSLLAILLFCVSASSAQTERSSKSPVVEELNIGLVSGWRLSIRHDASGGVWKGPDHKVGGNFAQDTFDAKGLLATIGDRIDGKKRAETDVGVTCSVSGQNYRKTIYLAPATVESLFEQGITAISPVERAKVRNLLKATPLFSSAEGGKGSEFALRGGTFFTASQWSVAIQEDGSGTVRCKAAGGVQATFKAKTMDLVALGKWLEAASLTEKQVNKEPRVSFISVGGIVTVGYTQDEAAILSWIEQGIEGMKAADKLKFKRRLKDFPPF